ncbi:GHKL domain-containing protein [Schaalia odontolytica]
MFDSLPDIPRLFTALAEWGAALVYVFVVARSASTHALSPDAAAPRWRLATAAFGGLAVLTTAHELMGRAPLTLWVPGMMVAYALVWVVIRVGTALDWRWVTHMSARAFIVAELAASLAWQVVVYSHADKPFWHPVSFGGYAVIASACLGVAYVFERRVFRQGALPILRLADLASGVFIGIAIFALSNLSFISTATPFSGRAGLEVFYIRTLVDLAGYAILFAQVERIQQSATERELASIQASLDAQHHQYLVAKEDMEQVARAHHDLKHRVEAIRAELDPGRAARSFAELESSIEAIGQQYHSGNAVLDVVLTTKGRACAAAGITLTVVADGTLLERMSSMDIATLFGNALDNAIEASRRVPDPDRRLIRLALFQRGQMTVIRVENWFDGHLNTDAGGRLTTIKQDTVRHGWGVKSIQWTARHYGGQAITQVENHWFTLTILLPSTTPKEHA